MHGTAKRTSGNLQKHHLKYNKSGKIVSKKASLKAHQNKNLGEENLKNPPLLRHMKKRAHPKSKPKRKSPH